MRDTLSQRSLKESHLRKKRNGDDSQAHSNKSRALAVNRFQEHRVIWKRRGAFRSATCLFCPPAGLRWGQGPVMGGTAPPRRQGSAWIPPAGPRRSAAGRRTCPREPPPQSGPPRLSSPSPPRNLACPHPMSGPRLVPRCAPVPRSAEETTCSLSAQRLEGRRGDVDPDSLCSRLGRKAHREVLDDGDRVGPGAAPAGGTQRAVARGAAV